jgi:hypothetical protein
MRRISITALALSSMLGATAVAGTAQAADRITWYGDGDGYVYYERPRETYRVYRYYDDGYRYRRYHWHDDD